MIRNPLVVVQFAPFAIAVMVAVAGAVVALVGGLAGWAGITELGKLAAGLGALGFFCWLGLLIFLRSA